LVACGISRLFEEDTLALEQPFPELEEFLAAIGAAGQRVSEMAASEGAAGNISICIGWPIEVRRRFPHRQGRASPDC
jgi:rhamnulose-1-phosphate aldolase